MPWMEQNRWKRVTEIFHAALTIAPSARTSFLKQECGNDVTLLKELQSLLAAQDSIVGADAMGSALDSGSTTDELTISGDKGRSTSFFGSDTQFLKRFHLKELVGRGGMGEVYLADQIFPLRRRVALKLIRPDILSPQVISRFEAELQTLALMEHPAIARVLDGGRTDDGQPFIVMEYLPGVPITDYCDQHRLRIRERLQLFVQVCEGVQHAHYRGIVHRDLKPTNVLVTTETERPRPVIIDFGIAGPAILRDDLNSPGIPQPLMGTLEYMSPEQLDPSKCSVDIRTDVYSLGVILYELLTGTPPFDWGQMGRSERIRCIRELEPALPSSSIGRTRPTNTRIWSRQGRTLRRQLRGNLDLIIMKAMAKDPRYRYGSSAELADDLRRHLGNEPVVARRWTADYLAWQFARRHRVSITISLAIMSFGILMAIQLQRLSRAHDKLEQTNTNEASPQTDELYFAAR